MLKLFTLFRQIFLKFYIKPNNMRTKIFHKKTQRSNWWFASFAGSISIGSISRAFGTITMSFHVSIAATTNLSISVSSRRNTFASHTTCSASTMTYVRPRVQRAPLLTQPSAIWKTTSKIHASATWGNNALENKREDWSLTHRICHLHIDVLVT